MALKENYKDDILDVSVNTKRKYRMTENQDGTVSFDDETVYTQEGDSFGSGDINAITHAVNNIATDAEHTSYDNTESGLQATNVQDAVDEINDNLSGFKFYPSGTSIVGLISDDSAYVDEDGNYVVWGTETANQLVADNPNTYKSVASTEDTRGKVGADTASPFSGTSKAELLWTNPAPTSAFAYGTTISLDLTDYEAVIITASYSRTRDIQPRVQNYIPKNVVYESGYTSSIIAVDNTSYGNVAVREIKKVIDDGVYFGGQAGRSYHGTTSNENCIPQQIFGVKKAIVMPS